MLTQYQTKLLRPKPEAPAAVCPFCRAPGVLTVVRVHGKAHQRVVGCRCQPKGG